MNGPQINLAQSKAASEQPATSNNQHPHSKGTLSPCLEKREQSKMLFRKVCQDPAYFIAFGFGSGLMPVAPGTWGTLAAMPLYLILMNTHWSIYLTVTVLAFFLGVKVSDKVVRDLGIQDYKGIVWDEIVGYLLTMFLAPPGFFWMLAGFILFRLFDIWKPQPIRLIDQKLPNGLGVMLDDVLAAIPAWLLLQLLAWSLMS